MQTRTLFLAAAASAVVLAAAGIGLADTGGDDTVPRVPTATATPIDGRAPRPAHPIDAHAPRAAQRHVVAAGPAGSVAYQVTDVLTIASVDPAPGWIAEVEWARGAEIEVVFTNGARRTDVEVEMEDRAPRERVRERTGDTGSSDIDDDRGGGDDRRGGGDDWRGGSDDRERGHSDAVSEGRDGHRSGHRDGDVERHGRDDSSSG